MPETTEQFQLFNSQQNKNVSVVVCIDGLDFCFSNRAIYSKVKYGDPGITYGQPGLVYGALRVVEGIEDILSLEQSSLTIGQAIEPEQGRASVSQLNLAFIDKNEIMSQVVSPGVLLPEILGRGVTVQLGYQDISYPQDYFYIFRGFITAVKPLPGLVVLQVSDANVKRRQNVFFSATTRITAPITAVATTIPVAATSQFHQQILGPNGVYDPAIKTFIKIDDEYIQIPPSGATPTSFVGVTRAARGSLAAAHLVNADVSSYLEIQDHAIDMALKLMLSGWAGTWISSQPIASVVATLGTPGNVPNSITFPSDVEVVQGYGLTVGDYCSVSGSAIPANNFTNRKITQILDFSTLQKNRIIVVDGAALGAENTTAGLISFRSKYDTYPTSAGCLMRPSEVDVQGHEDLKDAFLGGSENSYRFLLSQETAGKGFIESEIFLPLGCYSLTRNGRISVNITKPPLAAVPLVELNFNNIVNPESVRPERSVNSRTFFNDIIFTFDFDDEGSPHTVVRNFDADSFNLIGLLNTLPITSRGMRSDLATNISQVVARRTNFLLSRYKRGAVKIPVETNWGVGNQIEAGDVVSLNGAGLFITNFNTGTREFGTQLFEVVDRKLTLLTGRCSLVLISGVGASASDRFATISPSSDIGVGSTTTQILIKDSYPSSNPKFPGQEYKKWTDLIGSTIAVHSEDFTFYEEVVFTGFDAFNPLLMNVLPALSVPPPAGYVVDIARYSTSTDPTVESATKNRFAHVNPTALVVTGISSTQFTVSAPDAALLFVGAFVRIHNLDFTIDSQDAEVLTVVGVTVTLKNAISFTPAAGQFIELIGYADQGGAYRWL